MRVRWLVALVVVLLASPAFAQAPPPPNQWHPFRGSVGCVQYVDANNNFNCDSLVVVNPVTHTIGSIVSSSSGGPLVVGTASQVVALGTDLVLQKTVNVAPIGPGVGDGITLRVRRSPVPGYCRLVAIAGNAFGVNMEFPVAFLNPAYPFIASGAQGTVLYDQFVSDLPGGPGGC